MSNVIHAAEVSAEAQPPVVRAAAAGEIGEQFPNVEPSTIAAALLLGDGTEGRLAFGPESFDSAVLGLRIGRIISAEARSTENHRLLLMELKRRASDEGYQQILRRTGLGNLAEVWALEHGGFELMDVVVTFARTLPGRVDAATHEDLTIRPSTDRDIEQIADAMVRVPWGSRYEADPAYDPARVRELRSRWLWNSHRGRADVVLVGVLEGRPAGYVTCRIDRHTRRGEIELVGTLPAFRGRQVASRVLAHAVAWFSTRTDLVTVRTQATNTAAANLYETGGFTLRASDLTFRLALEKRTGAPS